MFLRSAANLTTKVIKLLLKIMLYGFAVFGAFIVFGIFITALEKADRAAELAADLKERGSYEVNVITRWPQMEFIPDCRENCQDTRPNRSCGGDRVTVMQYFQGPDRVLRSQESEIAEFDGLPNVFVNLIASSMHVGEHFTLHLRCTPQRVRALMEWAASDAKVQRDDVITVTYLAMEDPWAFCLHRDRHSWDFDINAGLNPTLAIRQFWLWRGGRVIGVADCFTTEVSRSIPDVSPQCVFDLWWDGGDFAMTIGVGIPATSFRQVLTSLGPATERFWQAHSEAIAGYEFDRILFYPDIELSDRAARTLAQIELEVK